jgi:hypothetical protein
MCATSEGTHLYDTRGQSEQDKSPLFFYLLTTSFRNLLLSLQSLVVFYVPTGLTFKPSTFCSQSECMCLAYSRTNSDYLSTQHELIGFYDRDRVHIESATGRIYVHS